MRRVPQHGGRAEARKGGAAAVAVAALFAPGAQTSADRPSRSFESASRVDDQSDTCCGNRLFSAHTISMISVSGISR
jgi:hypothetical protein